MAISGPVVCLAAAMGVILLGLIVISVRFVPEWERGMVFRQGHLVGARGPGLFLIVPFVDRVVKVDLRTITVDIPTQRAITHDDFTVQVNGTMSYRVFDPQMAVTRTDDFWPVTWKHSLANLHSVIGQTDRDELLANPKSINDKLIRIVDKQTRPWGVEVCAVDIKIGEPPITM